MALAEVDRTEKFLNWLETKLREDRDLRELYGLGISRIEDLGYDWWLVSSLLKPIDLNLLIISSAVNDPDRNPVLPDSKIYERLSGIPQVSQTFGDV
jgi:hypothetical protein